MSALWCIKNDWMLVKITDDIELRCTAKLDTDQHPPWPNNCLRRLRGQWLRNALQIWCQAAAWEGVWSSSTLAMPIRTPWKMQSTMTFECVGEIQSPSCALNGTKDYQQRWSDSLVTVSNENRRLGSPFCNRSTKPLTWFTALENQSSPICNTDLSVYAFNSGTDTPKVDGLSCGPLFITTPPWHQHNYQRSSLPLLNVRWRELCLYPS